MASCWQCTSDLGPMRKVLREELCEKCANWVHSCKNCRFWDDSSRTCEEPAADWVHDRERANFCDHFTLPAPDQQRSAGREPERTSRDAFDRLFRK